MELTNLEQNEDNEVRVITEGEIQDFVEANYDRILTSAEMEKVKEAFMNDESVFWKITELVGAAVVSVIEN